MTLPIIVRFLALVTVVCAGKETRHFRNPVVVIVVHVQVNLLVFLRTAVNNLLVVLFGHNINLILGQIRLKLLGFFDTTRTQRNVGFGVQFLRQSGLNGFSMISDTLVLGVIINFCFRDHKRASHT